MHHLNAFADREIPVLARLLHHRDGVAVGKFHRDFLRPLPRRHLFDRLAEHRPGDRARRRNDGTAHATATRGRGPADNRPATHADHGGATADLHIAHRHDVDIEGACEGSLACSTCHVIVDASWFGKLATPTEDEEDMLDLAFDLQETSRLGCQLIMTEKLDGLVVKLPAGSRNAGG